MASGSGAVSFYSKKGGTTSGCICPGAASGQTPKTNPEKARQPLNPCRQSKNNLEPTQSQPNKTARNQPNPTRKPCKARERKTENRPTHPAKHEHRTKTQSLSLSLFFWQHSKVKTPRPSGQKTEQNDHPTSPNLQSKTPKAKADQPTFKTAPNQKDPRKVDALGAALGKTFSEVLNFDASGSGELIFATRLRRDEQLEAKWLWVKNRKSKMVPW